MRGFYRRHAAWLLLAACVLCMAAAAVAGRARGRAPKERAGQAVAGIAASPGYLRAEGEALPLRAYLPEEPLYWAALRAWRTHPALDMPGETATALRAGRVARVWADRLWGVCVEVDCGGETWVYRSLARARVRPGDALAAGDAVGTAGVAPAEEELGAHIHIERMSGGRPADPLATHASASDEARM